MLTDSLLCDRVLKVRDVNHLLTQDKKAQKHLIYSFYGGASVTKNQPYVFFLLLLFPPLFSWLFVFHKSPGTFSVQTNRRLMDSVFGKMRVIYQCHF